MNKIAKNMNSQQLAAQKAALISRLKRLFATGGAVVEPLSALIELKHARKHVGRYHIDCVIQTADGPAYYLCFGYDKVKAAEHPFFIRIEDHWFDGFELIAKDEWFRQSLSEVMNIQGRFNENLVSLKIINVQTVQTVQTVQSVSTIPVAQAA